MAKKKEETIEISGGGALPVTAYKTEYSRDGTASAALSEAAKNLDKWSASAPTAPTGKGEEIEEAMESLRKENFDFSENELAKKAEDSYEAGAKRAAEDAMAKSVALTGGYANSWAQSAADSAYNKYMSQYSGEVLPNLYKTALSQYETELQVGQDYVKLLSDLDSEDFDRYESLLKQYFSQGDSLRDFYGDIYKTDTDSLLERMKLLASL